MNGTIKNYHALFRLILNYQTTFLCETKWRILNLQLNDKNMKYTLVNESAANSMRLQSIGNVLGTPASEIKKGDNLMWNFGSISIVANILKETDKTLVISESYEGRLYERKLAKKRLVCILK